ncbi:MAG: Gfo/Idh/MocA family protein [Candidatus Poribacteria bacterium]
MRIGMIGLSTLYWPIAIGEKLKRYSKVDFLSVSTLGISESYIKETLGLTSQEYADRFNIRLYQTPEDMVEKESLDTVVITTRHTEHAFWAEKMAKLGLNIYIPKTFATTIADADRIVEAQRKYKVKIAVGPSARFLPPFVSAKNAIENDAIGKPFSMRICHHHGTIDVFKPNDWYRDPKEGGPELSLGWYGIDLILYFMQDKVKRVFAEYGNFTSLDSPFMDCGRINIRMANGGIASFDMYFCNRIPYPSWQMEIIGPKGVISIHRVEGNSNKTVVSLDNMNGYQLLPLPDQTRDWETFWVDDFISNRQPEISAEEARAITLISLSALESANKNCPVDLP